MEGVEGVILVHQLQDVSHTCHTQHFQHLKISDFVQCGEVCTDIVLAIKPKHPPRGILHVRVYGGPDLRGSIALTWDRIKCPLERDVRRSTAGSVLIKGVAR